MYNIKIYISHQSAKKKSKDSVVSLLLDFFFVCMFRLSTEIAFHEIDMIKGAGSWAVGMELGNEGTNNPSAWEKVDVAAQWYHVFFFCFDRHSKAWLKQIPSTAACCWHCFSTHLLLFCLSWKTPIWLEPSNAWNHICDKINTVPNQWENMRCRGRILTKARKSGS